MRGDWIVTIIVLLIAVAAYALTWRGARRRMAGRELDRALSVKAGDLMSRPVIAASPETTLEEAAERMLERQVGCLPVIDAEGRLAGIVTESDLSGARLVFGTKRPARAGAPEPWQGDAVERVYEVARERPVSEVMTKRVAVAREDEPVSDVALRMIERRLRRLPVMRDETVVGVITRRELLQLLTR